MPHGDPYHRASVLEYECTVCGNRVRAEHLPGRCPVCGGTMQDVSVPRE